MSYSIKVVIRLDKTTKSTNEAPVCLRIIKDRQTMYRTIFKLKPELWDKKNSNVRKAHPNSNELNTLITSKKSDIEKEFLLLNIAKDEKGVGALRNKIQNKTSLDLFQYAENYIQQIYSSENYSLYKKYKSVIKKLKDYTKKDILPIGNINIEFISKYEIYLSTQLKNNKNTITVNMKVISKLLGDIYKSYKLDSSNNPFKDYKFKSQPTDRAFLIEEEIKRIEALKFTPINQLYDARDIFLLECYTGLRISDLLTLKWKNYNGEKLSLCMRKTEKGIEMPLSNQAKKIIEKRRRRLNPDFEKTDQNKYIFTILKIDIDKMTFHDAANSISSATAMINARLKRIATKAQITKNLSTHIGRHSFATELMTLGANVYYVKELLGHSDIRTTQIYAKVVESKMQDTINLLNR